jgi:2-polyprenyl-6-methoxyphenol hydroxylase-like FAD-dependent oxidoreductase
VATVAPYLADRVGEIAQWDDVKLLTVRVDRLDRWYRPGLLCIGDAAHAMSPVGGVGINLAVQDAVASANLLVEPLRAGTLTADDLQRVQQKFQVLIQNRVISRVLETSAELRPPAVLRWLTSFPVLRRIPARLIGLGVRPEHVSTAIRAMV